MKANNLKHSRVKKILTRLLRDKAREILPPSAYYKLKDTVIIKNDIIFSLILYGIYMIWLKITHNQTVKDHYDIRMKEVKETTELFVC